MSRRYIPPILKEVTESEKKKKRLLNFIGSLDHHSPEDRPILEELYQLVFVPVSHYGEKGT